eukprot:TRINITY_DN65738_c0_g1_i1.p1 TRINITY_DN65738_c0_g1~~TRINITY_DN65738_c0_g1_i1.p1  ORF type:complete len:296 (-),score=71.74 TRINITY_DN65738_c0_g1_i1:88-912(-)
MQDSMDPEELRQRVGQALQEACLDGRLASALESVCLDSARTRLRQALLQATEDGRLADALVLARSAAAGRRASDAQVAEAVAQVVGDSSAHASGELLRARARDMLFQAAADGTLASALDEMSRQRGQRELEEYEVLRAQARETLLRAAEDGTLEPSLRAAVAERQSQEMVRLRFQARQALIRAASDGTLESLSSRARRNVGQQVERIMEEARARGRQACSDTGAACTCSVCLDSLKPDDDVCTLRCFHSFHGDCIEHWLWSRQTCPNCRLPCLV